MKNLTPEIWGIPLVNLHEIETLLWFLEIGRGLWRDLPVYEYRNSVGTALKIPVVSHINNFYLKARQIKKLSEE